jgi:protein gp37
VLVVASLLESEDYDYTGDNKMGEHTKIEFADSSWNPVTGCYHCCEYCYASNYANKHIGFYHHILGRNCIGKEFVPVPIEYRVLKNSLDFKTKNGAIIKASYPFGFEPTFHRYRLNIPKKWKEPKTILVASMGDLFGSWVPDSWKDEVFDACLNSPQHRYLFLTKDIHAYEDYDVPIHDNFWYGQSWDGINTGLNNYKELYGHLFICIEPLLAEMKDLSILDWFSWVIIGAETGTRVGKVVPNERWIEEIAFYCKGKEIPVFMKESLLPIMGEERMLREFPWGIK